MYIIQINPCSLFKGEQRTIVHKEVQIDMTNYEITYIISPAIDEAAKTALVERFDNILKNDGAEIVDSKDWSKRRFAYEIGGFSEGIYHIVNIKAENADAINEFDRLAKINDGILRHMIVKRED